MEGLKMQIKKNLGILLAFCISIYILGWRTPVSDIRSFEDIKNISIGNIVLIIVSASILIYALYKLYLLYKQRNERKRIPDTLPMITPAPGQTPTPPVPVTPKVDEAIAAMDQEIKDKELFTKQEPVCVQKSDEKNVEEDKMHKEETVNDEPKHVSEPTGEEFKKFDNVLHDLKDDKADIVKIGEQLATDFEKTINEMSGKLDKELHRMQDELDQANKVSTNIENTVKKFHKVYVQLKHKRKALTHMIETHETMGHDMKKIGHTPEDN